MQKQDGTEARERATVELNAMSRGEKSGSLWSVFEMAELQTGKATCGTGH